MPERDAAPERDQILHGIWHDLTSGAAAPAVTFTGPDPVLPTAFRVTDAAAACVGMTLAQIARLRTGSVAGVPVRLSTPEAVAAFRSERLLRVDGRAVPLWDPITGDYRTRDGWIRLHANYSRHRLAAMTALSLPADADRHVVTGRLATMDGIEAEEAVYRAGGAAAALRSARQWRDHPQSAAVAARPLVEVRRLDGPPPSATGDGPFRVLDLTRVIAGPTATKVLAAAGAEVLRVDPPGFEEVAALVPDTTAGKRCGRLDLGGGAGSRAFADLVRSADVLVCGLRPGALDGLGLDLEALQDLRPGLILAELSAYGDTGPWAGRRGFDSLVQQVSGIAAEGMARAGSGGPEPLPVQALDHASGWLLAAGVLEALHRRAGEGGGWHVSVLLARTAAWLDGLGRDPAAPDPGATGEDGTGEGGTGLLEDGTGLLEDVQSPLGTITRVRFPGRIGGLRLSWGGPPARLGAHPCTWSS